MIQNLSHMLLIFTLSFVKLMSPLLRFSSCTHDQNSGTPTYKNDNSYIERYAKTCFFHPPKIKTLFICHEFFSPKLSYAKKEVWGYAKKRETHKALKIAKEKKKRNT